MLVITGIFENERFIPDKPVNIPQKKKVTVTIEEQTTEASGTEKPLGIEGMNAKKHEAFRKFMQYKGMLPVDFDYKKELAEARNERYGHYYTEYIRFSYFAHSGNSAGGFFTKN